MKHSKKNTLKKQTNSKDLSLKQNRISTTAFIYFDGGARGNPGPAGAGWIIKIGDEIVEGNRFLGIQTNNQAEYQALIYALKEAITIKDRITELMISGDSDLVIKQLNGTFKVRSPKMIPLYEETCKLLTIFDNWTCQWIPRLKNTHADALANRAIDEAKQ